MDYTRVLFPFHASPYSLGVRESMAMPNTPLSEGLELNRVLKSLYITSRYPTNFFWNCRLLGTLLSRLASYLHGVAVRDSCSRRVESEMKEKGGIMVSFPFF